MKEVITFRTNEVAMPDIADGVLFDGPELALLVEGVEAGRVWPVDFAEWVRRKRVEATYRVTREVALGDALCPRARAWTLGQVLAHLGLSLASAEVLDEGARGADAAHAARPVVQAA
jgi:hypothetical protein